MADLTTLLSKFLNDLYAGFGPKSPGGGGGGGTYENTVLGLNAGGSLTGTGYANTLIGKNAGATLNGTASDASSNVMVGYGSGDSVTTGAFNTLVGTATGDALTTQSGQTHVGYHSGLNSVPSGGTNTFVGQFSGRGAAAGAATGISNTAVGDSALAAYTTADSCAACGHSALELVTTGDNNTAVGALSGRAITTATGLVALGFSAGRFETGSDKFFVNNQSRTNETGDRTLSLLYGVFAAAAANQTLTCNGVFDALYLRSSVGNALTAAGNNRATALQLAAQVNNVTTAAASTGVLLPVGVVGMRISIFNAGANSIQVYGTASEAIDGTAGSTGVPLASTKRADFFYVAANTWISAQMGAVSA